MAIVPASVLAPRILQVISNERGSYETDYNTFNDDIFLMEFFIPMPGRTVKVYGSSLEELEQYGTIE